MAKDPAFMFYSSDFLTGVIDLSMKERGQYITLICLQHQRGHLSEREIKKTVGSISDELRKKFALDDDGLLYNVRAETEIKKRAEHCRKQKENVSRRWNKNGIPDGNTTVLPLENENENENIINPLTQKGEDLVTGGNEKGVQGGKPRGRKFVPPSVQEVFDYCASRGSGIDAESFCDFYESKGWVVGKTPMKDWKAVVRTWEKRCDQNSNTRRGIMDELNALHRQFSREEYGEDGT